MGEQKVSEVIDLKLIEGNARSVRQLFSNGRYNLDFYQREYSWSSANINELIEDLTDAFLRDFSRDHDRSEVAKYQPYFLGPVVTAAPSGSLNIVDGQQRLTSLSLLIMHLDSLAKEGGLDEPIAHLVYTKHFGKANFTLDVDERNDVMTAIVHGKPYEVKSLDSASVRNIWDRYEDIVAGFPEDVTGGVLPYFIDWLLDRVVLVEIRTTDNDMALEIFETMNDRGSQLSPTDMLKTFLLVGIVNTDEIEVANELWRERISELGGNHSDFIKIWLRAKYAMTANPKTAKSVAQDFEYIGKAFHKWARDHREDRMRLKKPVDYKTVVNTDFNAMAGRYLELLRSSEKVTPGLEAIRYNAVNNFTLQYMPILAAVTPEDDQHTFETKARLISSYLDVLIARSIVNYKSFGESNMRRSMFELSKELRDRDIDHVRKVLADHVNKLTLSFDALSQYVFRSHTRKVRYLLSRITTWLEQRCEMESSFDSYMFKSGKNPYEIEHIWSVNDPVKSSFASDLDFNSFRNRIGDLILLPKSFNASYGAKPYGKKLPHYFGQNLLAQSLHPDAYRNNPQFLTLIESTGLPFKPYPDGFGKECIEERQDLYRRICELIWNPSDLGLVE